MKPALLAGVAAAAVSALTLRVVRERGGQRLLDAPRTTPAEAGLGYLIDALGGEVVRLRARDGVRLSGRWIPFDAGEGGAGPEAAWAADPHEAILLLHGYTGSIAPDLVEYAPFLRRTAGVLGLDFRGHGASDDGPTTFGVVEVEDVAGALAWLGERGITRVALFGTSMGGITALAAVAVLGDGSLASADADPAAPRAHLDAPRPAIVAVVGDLVAPALEVPIAARLRGPARRFVAARLFDGAASILGSDPRDTEPARVLALVEPVPVLLIHGIADTTVPITEGRRLAALGGPSVAHWEVEGADHSRGHATAPQDYERRVTDFLRMAFQATRGEDADAREAGPIIQPSEPPAGAPTDRSTPRED